MRPALGRRVLSLLLPALAAPAVAAAPSMPARGIAAHRGGTVAAPENTRAAFCHAVSRGAHQIELDVRASADGALVVIHDATVDRTTDGSGRVDELSLAELRSLDAGGWKGPAFAGECVPTLEEALAVLPANVWINVDVKGGARVAAAAAEQVCRRGRIHQAVIAARERDTAEAARGACDGVLVNNMRRGWWRSRYVERTLAGGFPFIQLVARRGLPEPAEVERLRAAGVRINWFEARPERAELEELFALGIHFPLVDDVDAAMDLAGTLPFAPLVPACAGGPCPVCRPLRGCGAAAGERTALPRPSEP